MSSKANALKIQPPRATMKAIGAADGIQVNKDLREKKVSLLEVLEEQEEEKNESEDSGGEGDEADENKSNLDAEEGEDENEDQDGNMQVDDLAENDDATDSENGRKRLGAHLNGNGKLPKSTQEVVLRIMKETGWETGTMAHEQSHEAMNRICEELRINMTNVDSNSYTSRKPWLGKWFKAVKAFAYQVGTKDKKRPKPKKKSFHTTTESDDTPRDTISQRVRKRARAEYNEDCEGNDDLADDEYEDPKSPSTRRVSYHSTRSPSHFSLPEIRIRASEAADRERVKHATAYKFGALKTFQDSTLKMFMDLIVKPHETATQVFGEIIKKQVGLPSQMSAEDSSISNGSFVHSRPLVDISEYLIKPVQLMEFADRCANRLAGCKNSCGCHGRDDEDDEV